MIKSVYIKKYSVRRLEASLTQPFRTSLGQHDVMENALISIELSDGTKGFGEAAVAEHITGETLKQTVDNLKLSGDRLIGRPVSDYLEISSLLQETLYSNRSAQAAIEMALMDSFSRSVGVPLWRIFGEKASKLATDITIVISGLDETRDSAARFYRQGFCDFKVKVGNNMELDLQRLISVKRIAPRSRIIIDANQGYSAPQALKLLKMLKAKGVRPVLVEQPVHRDDWDGLRMVSRLSGVLVCADESVRSIEDATRVIRHKAAGAINIKLMKFGLMRSREIALLARGAGLKLMIGGMMESALAMSASAHLACALGFFEYIDLDTPFFIKGPLGRSPYLSSRGIYDLSRVKKGIGIVPAEASRKNRM